MEGHPLPPTIQTPSPTLLLTPAGLKADHQLPPTPTRPPTNTSHSQASLPALLPKAPTLHPKAPTLHPKDHTRMLPKTPPTHREMKGLQSRGDPVGDCSQGKAFWERR